MLKIFEKLPNGKLVETRRVILRTIDGEVIVRPKAENISHLETEDSIWWLNEEGKELWDEGEQVGWWCMLGMHKKCLELEF